MGAQMKICWTVTLLFCYVLITLSLEAVKRRDSGFPSLTGKNIRGVKIKRGHQTANRGMPGPMGITNNDKKIKGVSGMVGNAMACVSLGGICQPTKFACQGRYVSDKCPEEEILQCCVPDGSWSVLCAGHNNNRVRACDKFGCGAFNSRRGAKLHKAVDIVCDDFGIIQAPFSGVVSGPVSYTDPTGIQYDGVKLISKERCVNLLDRLRYGVTGSATREGAIGLMGRMCGVGAESGPAGPEGPRGIPRVRPLDKERSVNLLDRLRYGVTGSATREGAMGPMGPVCGPGGPVSGPRGPVPRPGGPVAFSVGPVCGVGAESELSGPAGPRGSPRVRPLDKELCVMLLNMRPYRYTGSVTRGDAMGYVLPLQDRFSGITSHIKVRMCNGSDPTAFL